MAWIAKGNERVNAGGSFNAFPGVVAGRANVSAEVASGFLRRVYQIMALGLAVTGVVALLVASSPAALEL
ncbi:MAG TPA: hypothetical protein VG319_12950, partial [Polyangia bacterium]|nr:hypothetical protein [Polyangia bacterium]